MHALTLLLLGGLGQVIQFCSRVRQYDFTVYDVNITVYLCFIPII